MRIHSRQMVATSGGEEAGRGWRWLWETMRQLPSRLMRMIVLISVWTEMVVLMMVALRIVLMVMMVMISLVRVWMTLP